MCLVFAVYGANQMAINCNIDIVSVHNIVNFVVVHM